MRTRKLDQSIGDTIVAVRSQCAARKSCAAAIVAAGASSISQWPAFGTTSSCMFVAALRLVLLADCEEPGERGMHRAGLGVDRIRGETVARSSGKMIGRLCRRRIDHRIS